MQYMLLMCGTEENDDSALLAAEEEPCWLPWARELDARGVVRRGGGRLRSVSTATTVRTDGTEVLVADGPFAETKEQILGYDVIECADLDEAIYAASRHPVALSGGVVEVRPLLEDAPA
jgi:hypothetical protein